MADIIAIALIAAVAYGVYRYFNSDDDNSSNGGGGSRYDSNKRVY